MTYIHEAYTRHYILERSFQQFIDVIVRNNGPAQKLPLKSLKVVEGRTITEVRAQFGDWVYENFRLGLNRFEADWLAGPIPIKDKIGKELIFR